jgi:hypothetical protein
MATPDASLEVLIQIRDELSGLKRSQEGFRELHKEARGLGAMLKTGLGIDIARRGVDLLRQTLSRTVGDAFRLARELKQNAEAIGLSFEAYQVFNNELAESGVQMSRLVQAITTQEQSMAEARRGAGAAADAYRDLGLAASELEQLSAGERVLAVARATLDATDKTKAFTAAGQILGQRGIRPLLGALKNLSKERYDELAEAMKRANRIMSEDTAERLRQAEINIDRLKQKMTIMTGEVIGDAGMIQRSWSANWTETFRGLLDGLVPYWMGVGTDNDWQRFQAAVASANRPRMGGDNAGEGGETSAAAADLVLLARLTAAQNAESASANDVLLTEAVRRREVSDAIEKQIDLYEALARAKFGDDWKATRKKLGARAAGEAGTVPLSDAELAQYEQMLALQKEITAAGQRHTQAVDRPMLQLYRELADTQHVISETMAGALTSSIASLSNNIWGAFQGTNKWGDAFRGLGNIAGQVLTELMVKLMIVRPLMGMLGFDTNQPGLGGFRKATPVHDVALAGGGTFVTRGPTTLTVGDNPGGIELVTAIPLSGVGRSTVNGQALRMAGGGSALVAGAARGNRGDVYYIDASNADAAGIARLEAMIRSVNGSIEHRALAATFEARRRHQQGFR